MGNHWRQRGQIASLRSPKSCNMTLGYNKSNCPVELETKQLLSGQLMKTIHQTLRFVYRSNTADWVLILAKVARSSRQLKFLLETIGGTWQANTSRIFINLIIPQELMQVSNVPFNLRKLKVHVLIKLRKPMADQVFTIDCLENKRSQRVIWWALHNCLTPKKLIDWVPSHSTISWFHIGIVKRISTQVL